MGASNEQYLREILKKLKAIDYIKPKDIPGIDLYMDQVTTFMDEHLKSSKRYEDDKLLTKTMINNYTKNNLLPSPNKKKYSKEHMLLLIFIYYFKNFLSINDIQSIFEPLTEKFYNKSDGVKLEDIYEEVFHFEREQVDHLVKDVLRQYRKAEESFSDVQKEEDREFLCTFSLICMLSFDVYVKKMMIEMLIDDKLKGKEKRNEDKGKKEKKEKKEKTK